MTKDPITGVEVDNKILTNNVIERGISDKKYAGIDSQKIVYGLVIACALGAAGMFGKIIMDMLNSVVAK